MSRFLSLLALCVFFLTAGLNTSCGGDDDAAKKGKKAKKNKKAGKSGKKAKKAKKAKKTKKNKKAGKRGKKAGKSGKKAGKKAGKSGKKAGKSAKLQCKEVSGYRSNKRCRTDSECEGFGPGQFASAYCGDPDGKPQKGAVGCCYSGI